uniref:STAS domain-containing protein n=1 Tax=Eubacterium sp. TaxID=142586 RepID=UPI00402A5CDD
MRFSSNLDNGNLYVSVEGRLDTATSPEFQNELNSVTGGSLNSIHTFVLDLEKLDYISSAGLRVILKIYKEMTANGGKFIIKNVRDEVKSVFEVTGFNQIFTIE